MIKKNITLILGISIPILMILLVAGSIYLPGLFIKPHFNFLYTAGGDYINQQQYSVIKGKLVKTGIQQLDPNYLPRGEVQFYIYDVSKNKSREVSFEEAQRLNLDPNATSPDGFEVIYGSRSDGLFPMLFGAERDYSARYLKGHNVSKKLNLRRNGSYDYYYNFRFLGWIK